MSAAAQAPSWTADQIGGALARQVFNSQAVVCVDRCTWTGHECDVLVVTKTLRLIDVEVKISRADLRADIRKEKWWRRAPRSWQGGKWVKRADEQRGWPPRVWKHYFALPAAIWDAALVDDLPQNSGIITLSAPGDLRPRRSLSSAPGAPIMTVIRPATPRRDAKAIDASDALDIARLAGLRMWDAYAELERLKGSK